MRHILVLLALAMPAVAGCQEAPPAGQAGRARADHAATVEAGYPIGDPGAPIAVVEFSDFGCPYCARFSRTTFSTLRQEYIDTGRVRWRYVPVVFGFAGGDLMAAAGVCVARIGGQEAFWKARSMFYERQSALRGADARPRLMEWIESDLGVDRARVDACIDSPETLATLSANNELASEWFVRGTPTFVVNGVPMSGAMPIEFFRKVLDTVTDPSGM
jgi:protein-disulfide isomerase